MSKIREKCITPGCNNLQGVINYNKNTTKVPNYRKWCSSCHSSNTAKRHNLENMTQVVAMNAGYSSAADYINAMAIKAGFSSTTARANSRHPSRKHKKHYCENIDGRLGYKCNCIIHDGVQLQVDHIDGNPFNDDPSNLQTLCVNCHKYKTKKYKDHLSLGRKKLKQRLANAKYDPTLDPSPLGRLFDWQKVCNKLLTTPHLDVIIPALTIQKEFVCLSTEGSVQHHRATINKS